ncbi:domino helicase isoform X2 [Lycorma delicatula]|uniref:domino helicase isoform X2 n=1 Tax=Lycorma delicatula TaxID=130591 RepID=UPI003F5192FD
MNEGDLGLGRPRLQSPPISLSSSRVNASAILGSSNSINAANVQASTSRSHNNYEVTTSSLLSQQVITNVTSSSVSTLQSPLSSSSSSTMTRLLSISQSPRNSMAMRTSNNGVIEDVADSTSMILVDSNSSVTHPNLVNSLMSPITQRTTNNSNNNHSSNISGNVRKRKMSDSEDIITRRQRVSEHKALRLKRLKDRYADYAMELFFLQSNGNLMDFHMWRKRPATPQLMNFLRNHKLDPTDEDEDLTLSSQPEMKLLGGSGVTPVAVSTTLPPAVARLGNQQGGTPLDPEPTTGSSTNSEKHLSPNKLKLPINRQPGRPQTSYENSIGSQEQIVEKAKQEAYVMQRIGELQREGLWGEKRLPKLHEPSRAKAHWDYLLEEMVWMAADFAQERKWKKSAAKKCARMVQKYFQEKELTAQKAVKTRELQLKRIAGCMAKEIKTFWSNVEKLVEYKQQTRLEEKRKKALDQHLSFIVDQTEKYSSLVAESMNKTESGQHSLGSSRVTSPTRHLNTSDVEFEPEGSSSDDEETIEKAEAEEMAEANGEKEVDHSEEVKMLEQESQLPLEELLKDYLDHRETIQIDSPSSSHSRTPSPTGEDEEFRVSDKDSSDDEETIQEQEKTEGKVDHQQELDDLKAEGEMSIDELIAKYGAGSEPPAVNSNHHDDGDVEDMEVDEKKNDDIIEGGMEVDSDDCEEEDDKAAEEEIEDDVEDDEEEVEEEEDEEHEGDEDEDQEDEEVDSDSIVSGSEQEPDLSTLLNEDSSTSMSQKEMTDKETTDKEINDVAALAESIQPTGNTLSSTSVVTKIPFLLKHTLREYQHIGLDWLVTMHDRKLNGILADEMGLGKTIQTISLLAHLACEKGNWGPHLIVVPTSVMLNWEMELKKWCPGFKILTYYGSQKERRLKRTGWTKTNAFHVCITSYKLVIQDHQSFRRKKWKYLILDEAQNIKNFKSQRWQLLLNFQTQRRLLLTGTPLQNNLMELWSLMHFLMPNVFQSHREFKEWFSNPVTGMIEGNSEYNETIIKRLHKVLRPFLLRRLKSEVEKQLPKKYEHVVMCRLSNRQRYLYDDFMSRAKTRETLATGNLLSVINVLMQLRKVCNHPNLFEVRPTVSPFQMPSIEYIVASLVWSALDCDPFKTVDLSVLNLHLVDLELCTTAFVAHRTKKYSVPSKLIEEIDDAPPSPPRCPAGKIKIHVKVATNPTTQMPSLVRPAAPPTNNTQRPQIVRTDTSNVRLASTPLVRTLISQGGTQGLTLRVPSSAATLQGLQGYSVQLVQHQGTVKAIPVASLSQAQMPSTSSTPSTSTLLVSSQGETAVSTGVGTTSVPRISLPTGFAQLVQTPTGRHILFTSSPQVIPGTSTVMSSGQRVTVLSKPGSVARLATPTVQLTGQRPFLKVPNLSLPSSLQNVILSSAGVSTASTTTVTMTVTNTMTTLLTKTSSTVSQPVPTPNPGVLPIATAIASATASASTSSFASNSISSSSVSSSLSSAALSTATSTGTITTTTKTTTIAGSITSTAITTTTASTSTVTSSSMVTTRQASLQLRKKQLESSANSVFNIPILEERRKARRMEKLKRLAAVNKRRCLAYPIYGEDLKTALRLVDLDPPPGMHWRCSGFLHCLHTMCQNSDYGENYWTQTNVLRSAILSVEQRLEQLNDIISRFVVYVPAVVAREPRLHSSHPPPWKLWRERVRNENVCRELRSRSACLHRVASNMMTQFPDPRLIQYDCGKLQTLDRLLRQLKSEHHRVLIFTQMTKMLDVLESFLNYHGHIYLRLDGTTRVDQRQALMERFNADKRIFAFILTTRSGGIGVNLTGADTVIFYDSDWNPTMDAQAQDRCHRIGQTRDVHIYRLISEMTVEENILKKANQKRMLGDLAIEGGNFTTAYFKSSTIQDLFSVDASENDANTRMAEVLNREAERRRQLNEEANANTSTSEEKTALGALESALAAAEDETDVVAARTAKAEAAAELAEFDESIPLDGETTEELSKAEQEVNALVQQLSGVERYAMRFIEETDSAWSAEQLAAAEAEIEQQKREWEEGQLAALREEEEEQRRALAEETGEELLTYPGDDARQIWVSLDGTEQMPMWCPPTPPQDEGDVYIDHALGYLYEHSIMPESELPPVYYKKDRKRARSEIIDGRPVKVRLHYRDEASLANMMNAPRSLFDRPSPTLMKIRHELRLHKYRGGVRPSIPSLKPPILLTKTTPEPDVPEWLIHEDWTILQAIQTIQELPLSLAVISPGHIPNWDLVADIVNSSSRTYRSPKQCRIRYESTIAPREEGKILLDQNSKKQKKTKGVYKITQNKCSRVLRTSHLYSQDSNLCYTRMMNSHFDVIRTVAGRRRSTVKAVQVNPDMKNPKHAAVLVTYSIDYDNPLSPVEIATLRAERIQKQKEAAAAVQAATEQQQSQQQQTQLGVSRLQQVSAQGTVKPVVGIAGTSTVNPTVSAVSVPSTLSPAGSTTPPATPRPSRPVKTLTVQDIVARATVSSPAPSPTTPAHRMTTANLVTVSQASPTLSAKGKAFTPAQLQVYQHQLRQQQQLRQLQVQARAAATGSNATATQQKVPTVAVTSSTTSSPRVQQVKQSGVTRTMTESEMAALLKRQQVASTKTAAVASGVLAGPSGGTTAAVAKTVTTNLTPAQILAQAGLQAQQPGQVTALVKTAPPTHMPVTGLTLPQVKVGTAGMKAGATQQIRQLTLHQQLLASQRKIQSQKVTQLGQVMVAGKTGVPAQLIVQSQKPMSTTMTMQQIQQVIKHVQPQHITHVSTSGVSGSGTAQAGQVQPQVISHAVLTKTGQGTVTTLGSTRVIPVATTQQSLKQIQVVTASQGSGVRTSVSNVSLDSTGRPNVSVAAGGLSGTIKVGSTVSQQALLSQVSAALQQGQGIAVRQSPVRLATSSGGTPLVAVAVSQAPTMLTLPTHQGTTEGVSKVLPQLLSRNNTNQE